MATQTPHGAADPSRPESPDFTAILLNLIRLEKQQTDVLITINVPHIKGEVSFFFPCTTLFLIPSIFPAFSLYLSSFPIFFSFHIPPIPSRHLHPPLYPPQPPIFTHSTPPITHPSHSIHPWYHITLHHITSNYTNKNHHHQYTADSVDLQLGKQGKLIQDAVEFCAMIWESFEVRDWDLFDEV